MIRYPLLLLTLLLALAAHAQDTLMLRSGQEQTVKVLEINPTEVIYKRFDNLEGPTIVVLKSDVVHILYANGTREEFTVEPARAPERSPVVSRNPDAVSNTRPAPQSDQELYQRGRLDAMVHYQGNGAMWGTMAATLYPPAGLITGIVVGAVPPNPRTFYTPNPELLRHPAYVQGYRAQAHRRKIGKAAGGFGIGLGAFFLLAVAVTAGR